MSQGHEYQHSGVPLLQMLQMGILNAPQSLLALFHIGRNTDCDDALEHLLVPCEMGNHLICSTHMHDNAGNRRLAGPW